MKKILLENALNKPIALELKFGKNRVLRGYLVKDENHRKCYKILPLNIADDIIVFPPNYVKYYMFLENEVFVK